MKAPELRISDGTDMITTNGPQRPGKLIKPQKVFAGVDRVAVDVYGADLIGVNGEANRTKDEEKIDSNKDFPF